MTTHSVVKHFNVFEQTPASFCLVVKVILINQFLLQCRKETLGNRIVPAVPVRVLRFAVTRTLSPSATSPLTVPVIVTVPNASFALMMSSAVISASSVMVAAGGVVSRTAESDAVVPALPAAFVRKASTVRAAPSAGAATAWVRKPAEIWDDVRMMSDPLTVSVSPATASPGRPTRTSTLPDNSARLMKPSLLASSVMVTTGGDGALRSTEYPYLLLLPYFRRCPTSSRLHQSRNPHRAADRNRRQQC